MSDSDYNPRSWARRLRRVQTPAVGTALVPAAAPNVQLVPSARTRNSTDSCPLWPRPPRRLRYNSTPFLSLKHEYFFEPRILSLPHKGKMQSFVFFVFLTMFMAFLLNWIFSTYLHTCTPTQTETQKLHAQRPDINAEAEMDDFLNDSPEVCTGAP